MTVNLRHSLDSGQTVGTAITQGSGGNSAVGGNFFDTVTGSPTYTASAYRGPLAANFATTASATQSLNWTTSIGSPVPRAQGRAIITATTFGGITPFVRCRGLTVQAFRLSLGTDGHITLRDTLSAIKATSTNAMLTGNVWMAAWDVAIGASATGVLYIWQNPALSTPTESFTVNAANFGTNNIDEVNYGIAAGTINGGVILDDIGFTDQGVPGPPTQSITVSETTTISDTAARIIAASRAAAETTTLVDAAGRILALGRAQAEPTTVADAATRLVALGRTDPETTVIGDTAARTIAASRANAETTTIADAATRSLAMTRPRAETATVADAVQRSVALGRADGEALGIADAATRRLALGRTASETVSLADSSTRSQALIRPVSDVLLVADSAGRVTGFIRAVSESMTIADTATSSGGGPAPVKQTRTSVLSDSIAESRLATAMAGARLSTHLSGSALHDHM